VTERSEGINWQSPTVRTLVLLRHAKAANPQRVDDSDRPLTARGHADAAAAGAWLLTKGLRPALVLCSPARRTRETWHGVQVALGGKAAATRVVFEPALYESGAHTLLGLIRETDADIDVLMLVGHNPTISMVSGLLDPGTDPDGDLRTAGLAVHRLDGAWADYKPHAAPRTASHTARGA
jgi:phosphohistidine phosphatase